MQPRPVALLTIALLALSAAVTARAEVVFIDYDEATAKVHGEFPTRAQLADMVTALHGAGGRAVVLKFFFDSPGKEPDNSRLAEAIGKGRTVLQATINKEPPTSRDLPARFRFPAKPPFEPAIRGDEGWLPLVRFGDKAARVCFVDVHTPEQVPMLEVFGGHPVPSLYACLLAEVAGKEMSLSAGAATFGSARYALNRAGEVSISLDPGSSGERISAMRIFAGNDWQQRLRGKVAVMMYTGPRSPTLAHKGRQEKVHNLFAAQVAALMKKAERK